jgi:hypothetical protein
MSPLADATADSTDRPKVLAPRSVVDVLRKVIDRKILTVEALTDRANGPRNNFKKSF